MHGELVNQVPKMGHRCCNGRSESGGEGRILCFRDIASFGAFLGSSQWGRESVSDRQLSAQASPPQLYNALVVSELQQEANELKSEAEAVPFWDYPPTTLP